MVTPEDLERYVRVMREGGVLVFKSGDTVIQLGPQAQPAPDPRPQHKRDDYGALLFAATEGLPDESEQS